jgi:hypothetical protein
MTLASRKDAISAANHASSEFGEILHVVKEVGKELKDLFNETVVDPSGDHPDRRL